MRTGACAWAQDPPPTNQPTPAATTNLPGPAPAATAAPDTNRLEELRILQRALEVHPADARATGYLGTLLYALRRYDEAMEAYLNEEQPSEDVLKRCLRKAVLTGAFYPILCGSAFKNKGVQPLLDAVVDYLPSPLDVPPVEGIDVKTGEPTTRDPKDDDDATFSPDGSSIAFDSARGGSQAIWVMPAAAIFCRFRRSAWCCANTIYIASSWISPRKSCMRFR